MTRRSPRSLEVLLTWLLVCSVGLAFRAGLAFGTNGAEERANDVSRHFGLLVGDRITQQVRIAVPATHALEPSSLPKSGRANRWLELQASNVGEHVEANERIYDVTLHYQVVTSDEAVALAALPRPTLRFVDTAATAANSNTAAPPLTLRLREQNVSVSPISDADAWDREGLQALRPERGTPLLDATGTKQRIAAYLAALAALAAYWLYRIFGVPFLARSRGPFSRAWQSLRRMRGIDPATMQGALRELHRAFDTTFGATVFHHSIDAFLAHHPRYGTLREPIRQFFELSRNRFYGAAAASRDEAQLSELRFLAQQLSLLERSLT